MSLMSMGFDITDCQDAITFGKNTVEAAVEWYEFFQREMCTTYFVCDDSFKNRIAMDKNSTRPLVITSKI